MRVNFDPTLKLPVTPFFPSRLRKETPTKWPFVQMAWKISRHLLIDDNYLMTSCALRYVRRHRCTRTQNFPLNHANKRDFTLDAQCWPHSPNAYRTAEKWSSFFSTLKGVQIRRGRLTPKLPLWLHYAHRVFRLPHFSRRDQKDSTQLCSHCNTATK